MKNYLSQLPLLRSIALLLLIMFAIEANAYSSSNSLECEDDITMCDVDLGSDITQCNNAGFTLSGPTPAGFTGTWSVVSGTALTNQWLGDSIISFVVENTATIRFTITDGTCSDFDDIVLTNNSSCSTPCTDPLNINGDLEDPGNISSYPLSFVGQPAAMVQEDNTPLGWGERYGSLNPNSTTFDGAFYLNTSYALSGSKMAYLKGNLYCYSPFATNFDLACGKTYEISVNVAAYSYNTTQSNTLFAIEYAISSDGDNPPGYYPVYTYVAPASTNINNLNWNRYSIMVTIPDNGYDWSDFYFTTFSGDHGIFMDDICIEVVEYAAHADAGPDQSNCSNQFTMDANSPSTGFTGTWTVLDGAASFTNANSPTSDVTITTDSVATLQWTVTDGVCSSSDVVVVAYEDINAISVTGGTICPGQDIDLTVSNCQGDLEWSTGASTSTITVNPTTETTYTVTCTAPQSSNLILNEGFENGFTSWQNWGGAGAMSTPANVRSGSSAAGINGLNGWGGFGQSINVVPGERYLLNAWVKSTNINGLGYMSLSFLDSSWNGVGEASREPILSSTYTQYTLDVVVPIGTSYMTVSFETGNNSRMYVDDVFLLKQDGCVKTASATVTMGTVSGVSATYDQPITCTNVSAVLTANPSGLNYLWSNGATTRQQTVSTGGVYTVTVTDADGCSSSDFVYLPEDNTQPNVSLSNVTKCVGESVILVPEVCENYPDINAQRHLLLNGWRNTFGEDRSALTGDGEMCFTLKDHTGETIQMIGLNDDYANDDGYVDIDYAIYVYVRPSLNRYWIYIRENGTSRGTFYNSTTGFPTDVEFCIRRVGQQIQYLQDGVVFYTSNVASTTDLYYDHSFYSTNSESSVYYNGYSLFENISLCGDIDLDYIWSNSATTNSISVTQPGTYGLTVTDAKGCTGEAQSVVSDDGGFSATIDFIGTACLEDNTQLTVSTTGTGSTFTYNWSGPNSFSATTDTIDANEQGNYFVTVTDNSGCSAVTSAFVYDEYTPFINSLSTDICEGESVALSINGSGNVAYQWGSNAGNATTSSVTVFPSAPNTTYNVTVTNDVGCTASTSSTINVEPRPQITLSGSDEICVGENTSVSASVPGYWTSSNTSIATVDNNGNVTGVSPGQVTFTFQDTSSGCYSLPTTQVQINPTPIIITNGPTNICVGDNTALQSSLSGGSWSSSNTSIATINGAGTITGVAPGTVTFTYTVSGTNCASLPSENITINPVPTISLSGPSTLCVGGNTTVTANTSGVWSSNNTSVATVDVNGLVTAVSVGTATISFNSTNNCPTSNTVNITVSNQGNVTISGPNTICEQSSVQYNASLSGGTWSSNNTSIATVSSTGVVTGVQAGSVTITYALASGPCSASVDKVITIENKPTVSIFGDDEICVGSTTQLSPSSGGTWTSSNNNIASVSNTGVVVGNNPGTVTFTFTTNGGCVSDATNTVTVHPTLTVGIDYNGSQCFTDDSQLTAVANGGDGNYTYSWTGPGGFNSTAQTIDVPIDGNYNVTVYDGSTCQVSTTAFIYERYEPFVFTLNTTVCEGESVNLQVSGPSAVAYQWGANAGNATTAQVTVVPSVPSSTYTVTVTNGIGCSTVASATINVEAKPNAIVTGSSQICVGETTTVSAPNNGLWTSSNYSVATVDNNGVVTGLSTGFATFTFQDTASGCYSNPSDTVFVVQNGSITVSGVGGACLDENPVFTSSSIDGTWSTSNSSIATIDQNGVLTPISSGNVTVIFNYTGNTCLQDGQKTISIYNLPNVSINGPNTICEGTTTTLSPLSGGTWVSSDPSIATVSGGTVTGVSGGKVAMTFTSVQGCEKVLPDSITVIGNVPVSLSGPNEICVNETTNLQPTSGGIWISSNNGIANVNSSGLVTGVGDGIATFTFVESTNGCISDSTINIKVNALPTIGNPLDAELCPGETTSINPSSGGTWTSNNTTIATIDNNGIITAHNEGSVRFYFTSSTTGCQSALSNQLLVRPRPDIQFTGPTTVCPGSTTNVSPSTGGSWFSTDVNIATINNSGLINAIAEGQVRFFFVNATTGCTSDTSAVLTIDNAGTISADGPDQVCVGQTNFMSPQSGGSWISSNVNIATINNNGEFFALQPGVVTFTFTSNNGCLLDPDKEVEVNAPPTPTFNGASSICVGETTNVTAPTSGTWSSNNVNVATVNAAGVVTGIGAGTTEIVFTDDQTGCSAEISTPINVYAIPEVEIIGSTDICIGSTTNLTPNSGGTWQSSNNNIAIISNNGLVTGVSPGNVVFTFTESGSNCTSLASESITVLPRPVPVLTGSSPICEGETTTFTPSTGGTWESTNVNVATIDDSGVVTGTGQGIARFTFTSDEGCESLNSAPLLVYGKPPISISGPDVICTGQSTQMSPSTGGVWTSTNVNVATIDASSGFVTSVAPGQVRFIYQDNGTGCSSDSSAIVTVNNGPTISINGPDSICIGSTTNFVPSIGGIWTALNPGIATIDNAGLVNGIASGEARFIFYHTASGCTSDTTESIVVTNAGTPNFSGPTVICVGDTTYINPSSNVTWTSNYPSRASITNDGMIIGLSSGPVRFSFVDNTTGCASQLSQQLVVNPTPNVGVLGDDIICEDETTQLYPSSGGVWTSLNTNIATVDNSGTVSGVSQGTAYFVYTDNATGCVSDGTLSVEVSGASVTTISSISEICVGYETSLSPTTGGIWSSSNSAIASISNFGTVKAKAPGKVVFTFESNDGSCGILITDTIDVRKCLNPDFNVAQVDMEIAGNVSTNDLLTAGTYSAPSLAQKPIGSAPQFNLFADGTYTFKSNKVGKYRYLIPVCLTGVINGCPVTMIEFTVIDNVFSEETPVANIDIATTYTHTNPSLPGIAVAIDERLNDKCVNTQGCTLQNLPVLASNPSRGTATISNNNIVYTPDPVIIGQDTLSYEICNSASECSQSMHFITINHTSASNSIVASDDFTFTNRGVAVSGNVMDNDMDPEGDNYSVVPQGSSGSPISINGGSYYINANGDYTFTPDDEFSGNTEIVYTICDENTDQSCAEATVHILVFNDLTLQIKVYLEGALHGNYETASDGTPLMRDNLRVSPYTGENYIPVSDPYTFIADDFANTPAKFTKSGPGLMTHNQHIADSTAVFSVTGRNAIVDWIHVELRSGDDMYQTIATRSGLLQRDGDIVDLDGVSPLRFDGVQTDSVYIVVKHRSHLGVMTMKESFSGVKDLRLSNYPLFNFGTSLPGGLDYTGLSSKSGFIPGYNVLYGGDMDADGVIKVAGNDPDVNILFSQVLFYENSFKANFDYAYGYFTGDFNMDGKAKYTNPDDDTNYLLVQVLFYPNNFGFVSNFGLLKEQVPSAN